MPIAFARKFVACGADVSATYAADSEPADVTAVPDFRTLRRGVDDAAEFTEVHVLVGMDGALGFLC